MTDRTDDPIRQLAALRSERGRALLERLAGEPADPETLFRLGLRLRRDHPADLVAAALSQHELRAAAGAKFSRAARMLFTRAGLEQASSETAARHRARRYAGAGRVADLCCGIGGDLLALAAAVPAGGEVLAVDRDQAHLWMALHNAQVYGVGERVRGRHADAREVDLTGVDAVFVDPARRTGTRRLPAGAGEPPLEWCLGLAGRVPAVGIKAAPGLPREVVPAGWEIEFVADGRDLKEAVLWSPSVAEAPRRATILPAGHCMLPGDGPEVPVAPPGAFLLDPNPAVTRAGLVEELARQLGAWKIDRRIAFLSTDEDRRTPFARTLEVVESAPWNERRFAGRLRALGVGAVDIRRRGLAGDVDLLRRRLKLEGDGRATVVLTRMRDRPWGLICVDPPDPAPAAGRPG